MKPTSIKPANGADRTLDVLHFERDALRAIFAPRSVAVIGATEKEGAVGRTLLWNLIGNPFGGAVYPINKRHNQVLGIKAYSNIARVPETIDLAVIVTPAPTVPGIVRECVAAGVKSAILLSAGFQEAGAAGLELEREIAAHAPARMRPIDADLQVPGTAKFKEHTGWQPQIPFEKTMQDLLEYWRTRVASGAQFLTR